MTTNEPLTMKFLDMPEIPKVPDFEKLKLSQQENELRKLHQDFQQAQDKIEALEKSNDVLWKVVAFLMEHI
jgi:hypothetical protein